MKIVNLTIVLAIGALFTGCAALDAADELFGTNLGEVAERESYERLVDYCQVRGNNLAGRAETINRLNSYDDPVDGPGPYFVAQDCDGDKFPDIAPEPPN